MEKSLYDTLHVADPARPETVTSAMPKMTVKSFAKAVLSSPQYRESIVRRILHDELPPAVETLLYHYAEGKPIEKFEVKDTSNPFENMSAEQLEHRLALLSAHARQLRMNENVPQSLDNVSGDAEPSSFVH